MGYDKRNVDALQIGLDFGLGNNPVLEQEYDSAPEANTDIFLLYGHIFLSDKRDFNNIQRKGAGSIATCICRTDLFIFSRRD